MKKVELTAYDPSWIKQFESERIIFFELLKEELINIFHIGSTSIPNMWAKPIVDLLIEVKDITMIDHYQKQCEDLGYTYCGEYGIPNRRYLEKEIDGLPQYHIHIYQYGDPEIKKHLDFKRYVMEHTDAFTAYRDIKIEGANSFKDNREKYQAHKSNVIQEIDEKAAALYQNSLTPMRKTKKLLTYQQCVEILSSKTHYGTLSFYTDLPYMLPLNHLYDDHTLYFHSGMSGYKQKGLHQPVCFNVVHDLGINEAATTNNFESVMVYGILEEEIENRELILNKLIDRYTPSRQDYKASIPLNKGCRVFKVKIQYMAGKKHFH